MYQLSDLETTQPRNTVNGAERDSDCFHVAKLRSPTILDELRCKYKEHLMSVGDNYRALIAPVRKLPTEILLDIFSLLCVDSPGLSITIADNGKDIISLPTLTIASTCSHWRNITLSHPVLWSNISVRLEDQKWDIQGLLNLYLKHSRPAMLSLTVTILKDIYDHERDEYVERLLHDSELIFRSFLNETTRWYRISFEMDPSLYHSMFEDIYLNNRGDTMSHLKHIKLIGDGLDNHLPSHFFDGCTLILALQTLGISGLIFDVAPSLLLDQLTEVDLDCQRTAAVRELIDCCPNLRALRLSDEHFFHDDPTSLTITSHSLESISISIHLRRLPELCDMLSLLNAPNLMSLSLSTTCETESDSRKLLDNLKVMIGKTSSSLRELTLDNFVLTDQDLCELLPLMPHLQRLTLLVDGHYDKLAKETLFSALHAPQASHKASVPERHLVPNLVHLEIHLNEYRIPAMSPWQRKPVDSGTIVSMLETRQDTLRHFKLCAALYSVPTLQWFESLEPGGLHWNRLLALHTRGLRTTLSLRCRGR
ncbi:hypothetical protein VKT23_003552 [Stygiomarasmius scandens]|uniref:F-box domain-containing protein n=1 Tax=Marasmiellus scandens TaxID=2682957 RepID=A0ABR1JYB3_9AGAR